MTSISSLTPSQLPQHPVTWNPLYVQLVLPICGQMAQLPGSHVRFRPGQHASLVLSLRVLIDSIVKERARQEGVPMHMKDYDHLQPWFSALMAVIEAGFTTDALASKVRGVAASSCTRGTAVRNPMKYSMSVTSKVHIRLCWCACAACALGCALCPSIMDASTAICTSQCHKP